MNAKRRHLVVDQNVTNEAIWVSAVNPSRRTSDGDDRISVALWGRDDMTMLILALAAASVAKFGPGTRIVDGLITALAAFQDPEEARVDEIEDSAEDDLPSGARESKTE